MLQHLDRRRDRLPEASPYVTSFDCSAKAAGVFCSASRRCASLWTQTGRGACVQRSSGKHGRRRCDTACRRLFWRDSGLGDGRIPRPSSTSLHEKMTTSHGRQVDRFYGWDGSARGAQVPIVINNSGFGECKCWS